MTKRIFIHFLDTYFLRSKGFLDDRLQSTAGNPMDRAIEEARLATRLAVISADEIYLPAASYYESGKFSEILIELQELSKFGVIRLIAGSDDFESFKTQKVEQYDESLGQRRIYLGASPPLFSWTSKDESSTSAIARGWRQNLKSDTFIEDLLGQQVRKGLFNRLELVPTEIGKNAFVPEVVAKFVLNKRDDVAHFLKRVADYINADYFASYIQSLSAGVVRDLVYLSDGRKSLVSADRNSDLYYRPVAIALKERNLYDRVLRCSASELLGLKQDVDIASCLARVPDRTSARSIKGDSQQQGEIGTIIVTALEKEATAVKHIFEVKRRDILLSNIANLQDETTRVSILMVAGKDVLLLCVNDCGTERCAALLAGVLVAVQSIRSVWMIGIAAGCPNAAKPDDHVRLGDVVIATDVVQHDNLVAKANASQRKPRGISTMRAITQLSGAVIYEQQGETPEWVRLMSKAGFDRLRPEDSSDVLDDGNGPVEHPVQDLRRKSHPLVRFGVIASGNILVKDPKLRDSIRDELKASAIEMEGTGAAIAAQTWDRKFVDVRGVVDYGNSQKNDTWHEYGAVMAACVAHYLMERLEH